MKLAIFTNTYLPHVGGVARSVSSLVAGMRERGHQCLVLAPDFPDQPDHEEGVVRIPSIQNFNGTDFSYRLPSGNRIGEAVKRFQPDLIHSHHPFLLGDAAMRMANQWRVPLVFTHHTRYEDYVHYVLDDADYLERLAAELATEYANLCDLVIAPSGSISSLIRKRGVTVPLEVIPTGIDPDKFSTGDRRSARRHFSIPEDCFLLGHVGRLAEEKNLLFLVDAVLRYLRDHDDSAFLVAGTGDLEEEIERRFEEAGFSSRLYHLGQLKGENLAMAYKAMNLFAFSSKSETQGMVLAESMSAGIPVIALDASGSRDIIEDRRNGRLLPEDSSTADFARGISELREQLETSGKELGQEMRQTVQSFSAKTCLDRLDAVYRQLVREISKGRDSTGWDRFMNRIEAEWDIAVGRARALGAAFRNIE